MGIYINGMEMPKGNDELRLIICSNGQVIISHQTYYEEAEAVPVPPHGDLIDRDQFIEFIKTHWDSYDQWFVEQLEARPTIIPASEEGE